MPVIGSDHHHRVDLLHIEQTAIIAKSLRFGPAGLFDFGHGPVEMTSVHVADRRDANVLVLQKMLEPRHSHAANTDHSHNDLVIRALGRDSPVERGQCDAGSSGFEESAS